MSIARAQRIISEMMTAFFAKKNTRICHIFFKMSITDQCHTRIWKVSDTDTGTYVTYENHFSIDLLWVIRIHCLHITKWIYKVNGRRYGMNRENYNSRIAKNHYNFLNAEGRDERKDFRPVIHDDTTLTGTNDLLSDVYYLILITIDDHIQSVCTYHVILEVSIIVTF